MNKTFYELSYHAVQQQKNIEWLMKENAELRAKLEIKTQAYEALKKAL